ncbi:RDD family protein [Candidatus Woesearchaeota archaeon]|nr:RDD family protein [Candidatus Woesearchaeota archaeon]
MKHLNLPKEKTFTGPASIWKRIFAFFVDIAIINLIILFPFRNLFKDIIPKSYSFSEAYRFMSTSTNYAGFITSITFVMSVLVILYFYMMEKRMGQTIGKMLMRIFVVSDSKELKAWQMLVRNLVFIPIFPFVLLWVIDPIFMFFTKTNQRLSEILSRTRVVERFSFEQQI